MKLKRVLLGRLSLWWAIVIWSLCSLAGFMLVWFVLNPSSKSWLDLNYWQALGRYGEALRLVNNRYVDENKSKFEYLTDLAVDGMIGGLDRHSGFYDPEHFRSFQADTQRTYVGVGIMIRKVEKGILITKVFQDGPAEKVGIRIGDFIDEVAGNAVGEWTLDRISNQIKGEGGTSVELLIRSPIGQSRLLTVSRQKIQVASVEEFSVDSNGTGYLHLTQFTGTTGAEVLEAMLEMREDGMKRMILDLRDNSGGLLSAAVEVAEIFVPVDQVIVTIRGRENTDIREFKSSRNGEFQDLAVVVLLNEGSASASEIVAGALAVLRGTDLIGEKSFGKGSVQTIFPLSDQSGLRLTTAMYFLPDGSTIHEEGLEPDFLVPCNEDNESKLRIQGFGRRDLDADEFEKLFGFSPIVDLQFEKAYDCIFPVPDEPIPETSKE